MNTTPDTEIQNVIIVRIETDELTRRTQVVHVKSLDHLFNYVAKTTSHTAPTDGATALPARMLTEQLWKLIGHRVALHTVVEGPRRIPRIIEVRDFGKDPDYWAEDPRIQKPKARKPSPPKDKDTETAFTGIVLGHRSDHDRPAGSHTLRLHVPAYGIVRFAPSTIDTSDLQGEVVTAYGTSKSIHDQHLQLSRVIHNGEIRA